jgi:Nucleoside diphosphate kinase
MEFDTESDPETLYELFGEDADALAESVFQFYSTLDLPDILLSNRGPVWVYVLERRRAVEVWSTLMGSRDFEVARRDAPNSLRSLYGLSSEQNGLMGSPDTETAEIQIGALFASSPLFATTDLPGDDRYGSIKSVSSSILAALRNATKDAEYAPSTVTNPSTVTGGSQGKLNGNGKVKINFKARPIPASHDKPDIVPRTTRAAALRAGQAVDKFAIPRVPVSKERLAQTFANVPGHKRMSTIAVASTAPPLIAPRMTRAASLRLGQAPPPPMIRKRAFTNQETSKNETSLFDGVPGHKRRESIAVASIKAPTVAPRSNKSAALRISKEQGPPTSFMCKCSLDSHSHI